MGRDGLFRIAVALTILGVALTWFGMGGAHALGGVSNTSYAADTFTPVSGSIDTTGGYVYTFNITTEEKTYRWVGLWGNATGNVKLGTTTNDFYTWGSVTTGSVLYATPNSTGIYVASFTETNETDLEGADTAYGYATGLTDNIESTYTASGTFQSPSMGAGILVNTTTVDAWTNYFIKMNGDTNVPVSSLNEIVWAVDITVDTAGFNGELMDFELLIPENEEPGDGEGTITTYYLWMELN